MDINFDSTLGIPYTGANAMGTNAMGANAMGANAMGANAMGANASESDNKHNNHHNERKKHEEKQRYQKDKHKFAKERRHFEKDRLHFEKETHHYKNKTHNNYYQEEERHGTPRGTSPLQKLPKMNMLIILIIIVIGFYVIFASLGSTHASSDLGNNSSPSSGTTTLEILVWGVFITLVLLNGVSYFFNFNINASLKNLFSGKPELDIIVDPDDIIGDTDKTATSVPELTFTKQVFHVPNNKYNYENAKAVCRAYGGRLATYKEVEDAYNDGADWCGFGWSDGQMALYPTQMEKWQTLQKIKGHEHDCGRPGVNGGYIANPDVKFGINCYGYKPKMTQEESQLMSDTSLYPKTQKELDFEKRVYHWKDKLSEILVAPFNHNNWSIN